MEFYHYYLKNLEINKIINYYNLLLWQLRIYKMQKVK